MSIIKFDNGTQVNFDGTPTQADVEEVATKLGFNQSSAGGTPDQSGVAPSGDLLDKAAKITSVIPGHVIGEQVGTAINGINQLLHGNVQGYLDAAKENSDNQGRVMGDTINVLSTVASLAAPVVKGAGILGTFAKNAAIGGISSATQAFGASRAKGEDWKTSAVNAFEAGVTGAAVSGIAGAATGQITNYLEKAPVNMYNRALNISKKIINAGSSPSEDLIKEGTWGTLGTIYKTAEDGIAQENNNISQKVLAFYKGDQTALNLANATASDYTKAFITHAADALAQNGNLQGANEILSINPESIPNFKSLVGVVKSLSPELAAAPEVVSALQSTQQVFDMASALKPINSTEIMADAVKRLRGKVGADLFSTAQLEKMIEEKVPAFTLMNDGALGIGRANQLRQQLDALLGPRYYESLAQQPQLREAISSVADALRSKVQSLTGTEKEFKNLSHWIETSKAADSAVSNAEQKFGFGGGLKKIIGAGTGAAVGVLNGHDLKDSLIKGGAGALIGATGQAAGESTALKTGAAVLLSKIGQLPVDQAGKISMNLVQKLIAEFASAPTTAGTQPQSPQQQPNQ